MTMMMYRAYAASNQNKHNYIVRSYRVSSIILSRSPCVFVEYGLMRLANTVFIFVAFVLSWCRAMPPKRGRALDVTGDAKAALASAGFDPAFGARPLKRMIQREIGDRLALAVLEGRYAEGDTVVVDVESPGPDALGGQVGSGGFVLR